MEDFNFIILILVGSVIGFTGTFVGLGGGILLVMLLIFMLSDLGFSPHDTVRLIVANSIFILLAMQGATFLKRLIDGNVRLRATLIVATPGIAIALIVAYLLTNYELLGLQLFKGVFVAFTLYVSVFLMTNRERGAFEVCKRGGIRGNWRNISAGGLAGFFTASLGVDSGTFIIPILNRYCDVDIRSAVNIYNSALFFMLLSVVIFYLASVPVGNQSVPGLYSYFYAPVALPLAIGAGLAAFFGFYLFKRFNFQYFVYPMVFIFAITALRILFADIISPLYQP